MDDKASASGALSSRVAAQAWYHTMDLGGAIVTPGWFDTRPIVQLLPIPTSLWGARCLDIGTFDGFWAFEMERRGAVEVVAVDILDPRRWDWPAGSEDEVVATIGRRKGRGEGFEIAREALGSAVRRLELSVYDVDVDTVGEFDFVYLGSLLLHLRDPVGALMKVRGVCRGRLLVVDAYDPLINLVHPHRPCASLDAVGRPWWWSPNIAALERMVEAAGFRRLGRTRRLCIPPGKGQLVERTGLRALATRSGRQAYLRSHWGDPHAAILGEPSGED
jgi:tRNA (mo5U34)-methyltransferase